MLDPAKHLKTSPLDLTEFAREHTGPLSWSAHPDAESLAAWALAVHDGSLRTPWQLDISPEDVPRVASSVSESVRVTLTHRESFVLASIDGASSLGALVDMLGLPIDEVLSIVDRLRVLELVELARR